MAEQQEQVQAKFVAAIQNIRDQMTCLTAIMGAQREAKIFFDVYTPTLF